MLIRYFMIFKEEIERRKAAEIESIRRDAVDKARKIASMLKGKYGTVEPDGLGYSGTANTYY
jgi:hypothetical protein